MVKRESGPIFSTDLNVSSSTNATYEDCSGVSLSPAIEIKMLNIKLLKKSDIRLMYGNFNHCMEIWRILQRSCSQKSQVINGGMLWLASTNNFIKRNLENFNAGKTFHS